MISALVFGATGAVGSNILATLLADKTFTAVKTISRRVPKQTSAKLQALQEIDSSRWNAMIPTLDPEPTAVFNAIGTTRVDAGSIANQWKIDHDLCIETVNAAKEAGVKIFVFISSGGTRGMLSRYVPYSKMKIGVEDAIKNANFEHGIVLRPGMIIGDREKSKSIVLETVIGNLHKISPALQDMIGQDQAVIGRAAVGAVRLAINGGLPKGYVVLEQADIVKFGRDERKE